MAEAGQQDVGRQLAMCCCGILGIAGPLEQVKSPCGLPPLAVPMTVLSPAGVPNTSWPARLGDARHRPRH
ncbi:MAG: hypothetical protein U0992_03785 [Planctomycetaceae bacterium]